MNLRRYSTSTGPRQRGAAPAHGCPGPTRNRRVKLQSGQFSVPRLRFHPRGPTSADALASVVAAVKGSSVQRRWGCQLLPCTSPRRNLSRAG